MRMILQRTLAENGGLNNVGAARDEIAFLELLEANGPQIIRALVLDLPLLAGGLLQSSQDLKLVGGERLDVDEPVCDDVGVLKDSDNRPGDLYNIGGGEAGFASVDQRGGLVGYVEASEAVRQALRRLDARDRKGQTGAHPVEEGPGDDGRPTHLGLVGCEEIDKVLLRLEEGHGGDNGVKLRD